MSLSAGLALGPMMPLEVSSGEPQKMLNWLFRAGFFTLIGFLCGIASDNTRSYLRHIKWLTDHDLSSSLPNHKALFEQLKEISADQAGGSNTYIFALILIENERELLSTFGIRVLDNAIAQLAKRLQKKEAQILSTFHISIAQLGVLISSASCQEDKRFFDKLCTVFQEPILFEGIPIHIDVRVGSVAINDPQVSPESYLQKAKSALAAACYKGSDHVSFNPAIPNASRENIVMLGELKDALTKKQLTLHYQPNVDIATGAVHGVEALLRWNHPQKGNIPPGIFIPRAEESTLINQITFFVLNQAMTPFSQALIVNFFLVVWYLLRS